jgi:hypothetical protein
MMIQIAIVDSYSQYTSTGIFSYHSRARQKKGDATGSSRNADANNYLIKIRQLGFNLSDFILLNLREFGRPETCNRFVIRTYDLRVLSFTAEPGL